MLFKKAENMQAFLKCGIMGFAGSGKTFTATNIAIGLVEYMRELNIPHGDKPAFFLDTETGSDWVQPQLDAAHIELHTARTRAFKDLVPAIKEAEQNGSVLIIDSISHFWRELTESFARQRNIKRLSFQHWADLKQMWGTFTDAFVNSSAHIILCGRAGYEYDFFEDDNGKKELEKVGVKMKAEGETGYEPSILVLMERHMDMETKKSYRTGIILKDRANVIDGKTFKNPKFEDFMPHVQYLNLGGKQFGVDVTRTSDDSFKREGKTEWQQRKEEKEIVLDEIETLLVKHHPSTSKEDKVRKIELIEKHFKTKSWKRVQSYNLDILQNCYNDLHKDLEGVPAYFSENVVEIPEEKTGTE